ncbi:MAG: hypothetical protein D6723_11825 [Acidobacteria bacterium]|nr:MAG: hypothetical protein D6723_11825 [Acidobacteriota bacterium]
MLGSHDIPRPIRADEGERWVAEEAITSFYPVPVYLVWGFVYNEGGPQAGNLMGSGRGMKAVIDDG